MKVINSYGIALKVGYFMMDNASNNDTIMEALSMCMYSLFKIYIYLLIYLIVLFDQYQIVYNIEHHRLRCNGHIINLAAQSFLFHTNNEDLTAENNEGLLSTPTELEMQQWQQKGPLGKLYNIIVYI